MKQKYYRQNGFTLVEMLVAIAIMGIFFAAIFSIYRTVLKNSAISEARTTAVALANQQLEMIHNLTYNDVATTDGWPQGDVLSEQVKTIDDINYTISTDVDFYDDPYDSLVPIDTLGSDYKKVKIEVTWDKYENGSPVVLYTDISPRGIEEEEQPGGVLSVEVFDNNNDPVSGATISVVNNSLGINFSDSTDIEGRKMFYSVTPDSDPNYSVSATKSGFTSDYTLAITQDLPDPNKPNLSVYEGETTEVSLIIGLLSTFNISTVTYEDVPSPIGSIQMDIVGKKTLGYDGENQPVVRNIFEDVITDGSGNLTLSDIEWDNYSISEDSVDYDIAKIDPPDPVIADAGENKNVTVSLIEHTDHTLRVIVLDSENDIIEGASVRIYNGAYDATQDTNSAGQVFFASLSAVNFNIEIQKDGYADFNDNIDIDGQTVREVAMGM